LIEWLLARGHRVRALARTASTARLPRGAEAVLGDALDAGSYAHAMQKGEVALVRAVESDATGVTTVPVPEIRRAADTI
jgi:uncharacterized protein YbjT (DUF2867 family)